MTNRYWRTIKLSNGENVPSGKAMCEITGKRCLHPNWWCSQCPIEYKDSSYEEELYRKVRR